MIVNDESKYEKQEEEEEENYLKEPVNRQRNKTINTQRGLPLIEFESSDEEICWSGKIILKEVNINSIIRIAEDIKLMEFTNINISNK